MKNLICLLIAVSLYSCADSNQNEEPFPQTNYLLTDIFVRYLEDTGECKSTVKLFTKNIMGKLIPDSSYYSIKLNNMEMKKIQNSEHPNWYNFEEKVQAEESFKYTIMGQSAEDENGLVMEFPMYYFGDIAHSFEGKNLRLSWTGKPLLGSEQIVIIAANNKGGIFTKTFDEPGTVSNILINEEELTNISQGRTDLYLVRKSRTKKGNEEMGLNLNSEIYSKTIKIDFPETDLK